LSVHANRKKVRMGVTKTLQVFTRPIFGTSCIGKGAQHVSEGMKLPDLNSVPDNPGTGCCKNYITTVCVWLKYI